MLKTQQLDRTCDHCMAGKIKSMPFPIQETLTHSERPFDTIHMDLLEGPVPALDHNLALFAALYLRRPR